MELMVAMAITSIIVTVLVSITSIALDTWNRSRSELRASHMGKMAVDSLSRDLEAMVVRSGNNNDWCSAIIDPEISSLGAAIQSTNASRLIFFTAPTDRYNGSVGDPALDKGGDVSCAAYLLKFRDPVNSKSTSSKFKTYVLNRMLLNPTKALPSCLEPQTQPIQASGWIPCSQDYTELELFRINLTFSAKTFFNTV